MIIIIIIKDIYLFVRFIGHLHNGETQVSQPELMQFY